MKTKKTIGFIIMAVVSASWLNAQITIGVKGGINISDGEVSGFIPGITPEPRPFNGANVGIMADIPLEGKFSFRPEFNFSQKGFVVRENTTIDALGLPLPIGGKAETRLNYLELPLLLQYRFGNEKAGLYVNGGPAVSYLTSGRIQPFATVIVDIRLPAIDLDLSGDTYNRFEFSGIAGAGGDVAFGPGKVFGDLRYTYGFTNTLNDPVLDTRLRNQGWTFTAGYKMSF
jgi:hypothetical protein